MFFMDKFGNALKIYKFMAYNTGYNFQFNVGQRRILLDGSNLRLGGQNSDGHAYLVSYTGMTTYLSPLDYHYDFYSEIGMFNQLSYISGFSDRYFLGGNLKYQNGATWSGGACIFLIGEIPGDPFYSRPLVFLDNEVNFL